MKTTQVIVSLTSFPAAMEFVPTAVGSIFRGSVQPDKVVLYLTAEQFPDGVVPPAVEALKRNPLFEVRFWEENIRSYTKLVPALVDFPDAVVITVDDDVLYRRNLVEGLLRYHRKYPYAVIGHRVRRIEAGKNYLDWKIFKNLRYITRSLRPDFRNMQTGVGGVLYPPHSLCAEMLDPKEFMSIAPTVDDVWFWAAAVASGTPIAPVPFGCWRQKRLDKPAAITLQQTNVRSGVDVNKLAVDAILRRFPIVKQRIEESIGRSVEL